MPALTQRLSVPWLVACSLAAVSSCQGSVSGLCTANFQAGHVVSFLFFLLLRRDLALFLRLTLNSWTQVILAAQTTGMNHMNTVSTLPVF